jgi:hypothetical protein
MLVRTCCLVCVITMSALTYSSATGVADEPSTSTNRTRVEARRVAEWCMNANGRWDPGAISMLFISDGVSLASNRLPIVQGRGGLERSWAELFKNVGGHETITVNDAVPVGDDAVAATMKFKIVGYGAGTPTNSSTGDIDHASQDSGRLAICFNAPQTRSLPSGSKTDSRRQ